MTKEEIIQAISDDKMMSFIQPAQLAQIVEFVINNYRPSLPSNLDEVAIPELEMDEWMKYGPHTNYPWCSVPDAIKITAEHFFALGKQAGAEWMAGQEYVKEGIARPDDCEIWVNLTDTDIKDGEKVIVKIRKK